VCELLEFRILGPLEVIADGRSVDLGGPMQRAALAVLVLNANRVVSAERLANDLYDGKPPATATTQVHRRISDLRKALGAEAIETRSPGYLLHVDPGGLDADRFEEWAADAKRALERGELELAADLWGRSLALWRGETLADFAYASFAQSAIARLEERRLVVLEQRFELELQLGLEARIVGELEAIVRAHPLRERLRAQLMVALYRCGRQADALDVYQELRAALKQELGTNPMPEVRSLHASILRQEPELMRARPHLATALPAQSTTFVGRERELSELLGLVRSDARLVTVTGAGGCGKTRLALRAAAQLAKEVDEVVWVPLASLTDPSSVVSAVARAIGREGRLEDEIGERRLELLLDNFEHVLEAAPALTRLLLGCPNLRLLVTSRERLNVAGEHEYPLSPMARSDAIALFRERARSFEPQFDGTDISISELCEQLDDLPLALELAAARVKLLSVEQLRARLQDGLGFDLLQGGRDADRIHSTLRATIDWSFNLLNTEEQKLLANLSVFAAGWTLEAAEAVCDANLETLAALIDKSLVRRTGDRYSMLATIRAYMADRLADWQGTDRAMHALTCHLLTLVAERTGSVRETPPRAELAAKLRPELDNLRAAVRWALGASQFELATMLTIESVWFGSGFVTEQQDWVDVALDHHSAIRPDVRARALYLAGVCAWAVRNTGRAEARLNEAVQLFLQLENDKWVGRTTMMLGVIACWRRDYAEAQSCFEQSVKLSRRTSDDAGLIQALHGLGELERRLGHYEEAAALLTQSERLAVETGDTWEIAFILHSRGDVAIAQLDVDAAKRFYIEALRLESSATEQPTRVLAYCFGGLAAVSALAGEPERAGRLWGAVEALQHRLDAPLLPEDEQMYEAILSGPNFDKPAAWNDWVTQGRAVSVEHAVAYALGECEAF
jgi:predicted ATPase/DNA-binding SARP family transcriptional activator